MVQETASRVLQDWPEESREAAQLVLEQYGEPHEVTPSQLLWQGVGPWKRIVATRVFHDHEFPIAHTDSVQSIIDYRVPIERFADLAAFDGSVVADRTVGEVSARCHDEQANFLAINLMHDIVTGQRSVEGARNYYAKEFLDYRRNEPTPYMEGLRFEAPTGGTADPDVALLSEQDLAEAAQEGS